MKGAVKIDVYIRTNDARLGRALALEARAAGFSAEYGAVDADARLTVYDLDFEVPDAPMAGSICIAREAETLRTARQLVQSADGVPPLFLQRPLDLELFRAQLVLRLAPAQEAGERRLLLDRAARKVSGAQGEVRLSARECALLAALGESGALSRERAAALFARAEGNVVDVYACYLRKKLASVCRGEVIRAQRGEGYALAPDVRLELL